MLKNSIDLFAKMDYYSSNAHTYTQVEAVFQTALDLIFVLEEKMKGNEKVIETLNALLAEELAAINQYMVHSEMCANWGYEKLHEANAKRAMDEMRHAEKLIARIIFLEGKPIVSELAKIHLGSTVEEQLKSDEGAESEAVKMYNDAIRLATELHDNGTRELLEDILEDEENHLDWLEAQLDQIARMGIQIYLGEQTH